MKLAFNVLNSGLGNNGGSRTIIKCQETIETLGHSCDIIGTVDRFTWFKHKPILQSIPKCLDAIIATSAKTVNSTHAIKARKKLWYIRAHERWANTEKELITYYRSGLENIVNSNGLKSQLENYGVKSTVIYQGIDTDFWFQTCDKSTKRLRIGCLYSSKPRKNWKHFKQLSSILGTKDYEYVSIGDSPSNESFICEEVVNGSMEQIRKLYSSCHIWFAPTDSEGLHNVPMEAALCGCLIVCANEPLNGMIMDYANENTAMIYPKQDIGAAAECVKNANFSLIDPMKNHIIRHIGSRADNMMKLIAYI